MTPIERQTLAHAQTQLLHQMAVTAEVIVSIGGLLNGDQTVDERPKPGPRP